MSGITDNYPKKVNSLSTQEAKVKRESQVISRSWRTWTCRGGEYCVLAVLTMCKNMRTGKFRVLEYDLGLKLFYFSKSHNVWEEKHVKLCILLLFIYIYIYIQTNWFREVILIPFCFKGKNHSYLGSCQWHTSVVVHT